MSTWKITMAAYLLGFAVTFGHAHSQSPEGFDAVRAGSRSLICSAGWPLYWSAVAWEKAEGEAQ